MTLSQKQIDEFKEIYKKKNPGKELTDEEARDAGQRLVGLVELVWDMGKEEAARAKRLKDEPDGFALDGTWTCRVCRNSLKDHNGWYDKYGMKCKLCQKALDDGIIPSFIFLNEDSYFTMWSMKYYFDLKHQTVKKMMKEGQLIAREILNEQGGVHEYVFLKKENPHCIRRYNAVRKSYDRNRKKKADAWERKMKKELLEEFRKNSTS